MDKFVISAALTGAIHTPTMSPHLPITPDELAEEARRASEAGAAVVHVHARDPETGQPSADSALFGEVLQKIRAKCDGQKRIRDDVLIRRQMRCRGLHDHRRRIRYDGGTARIGG